jgi:hypothetical protein
MKENLTVVKKVYNNIKRRRAVGPLAIARDTALENTEVEWALGMLKEWRVADSGYGKWSLQKRHADRYTKLLKEKFMSPGEPSKKTSAKKKVLDCMKDGRKWRAQQLQDRTGMTRGGVSNTIYLLHKEGKIHRVDRGLYRIGKRKPKGLENATDISPEEKPKPRGRVPQEPEDEALACTGCGGAHKKGDVCPGASGYNVGPLLPPWQRPPEINLTAGQIIVKVELNPWGLDLCIRVLQAAKAELEKGTA